MDNRRAILIILDGVGVGEMEDSHLYGDCGSNTLGNTARAVGGFHLPHLEELGLGKIEAIAGLSAGVEARGAYGKMREASAGKDTMIGHWEMMGIVVSRPFPVYPAGFPGPIIKKLEQQIGTKTLGNKVASGTVIIEELGPEHLASGYPIVYTSADSVFQVAAHEGVIPVSQLYQICQAARELLQGDHGVGRVIARPFTGEPGSFTRTAMRRDFSLSPPPNILDHIKASGKKVIGIGKIKDVFGERSLSDSFASRDNAQGMCILLDILQRDFQGLVFINLLDFDQIYGHRNDPRGFYRALSDFDRALPDIISYLRPGDLLAITSDHGCDPTTCSTDHSREYVPLLVTGPGLKKDVDLGVRETFADLGQTIARHLQVETPALAGTSFYHLLGEYDEL